MLKYERHFGWWSPAIEIGAIRVTPSGPPHFRRQGEGWRAEMDWPGVPYGGTFVGLGRTVKAAVRKAMLAAIRARGKA